MGGCEVAFERTVRLAGACAVFGATLPATYLALCVLLGWDIVEREVQATLIIGSLGAWATFASLAPFVGSRRRR